MLRTHFFTENPSCSRLNLWKWKINSPFFCKNNHILVRKVEILCLQIVYDFDSFVVWDFVVFSGILSFFAGILSSGIVSSGILSLGILSCEILSPEILSQGFCLVGFCHLGLCRQPGTPTPPPWHKLHDRTSSAFWMLFMHLSTWYKIFPHLLTID